MKGLSWTLALFLAAAAAVADDAPGPAPSAVPRPTATKSSKILKAQVVAAGPAGTITYKTTYGDEKTAAVETGLAEKMRNLKPGDKVTLVVREEGGEETVLELKKTASAKGPELSASDSKPSAAR